MAEDKKENNLSNPNKPTQESQDKGKGATSISTGMLTVTLLSNFTLQYDKQCYSGGTTLSLPKEEADFLIDNKYAVAGSLLPAGGMLIPNIPMPLGGSDS